VPNQAFARDALAISSDFKKDISYIMLVETTETQLVNKGIAGSLASAKGSGTQVQFVEYGKLKVVGSPQPLPGKP
jgi:hypothetical protein